MADLFASLGEAEFFRKYVTRHFSQAPQAVIEDFPCANTVDAARVDLAYQSYTKSISEFAVLLHSENPDHYKRSGALLHSLYKSQIVTKVEFNEGKYGHLDEVEAGEKIGLSYTDAQSMAHMPRFYEDYYNQLLSFDLAYKCCVAYEDNPTTYNFEYLYNMCHYLWMNENLSVGSCAMIFRSLMHRP